MNRIPLDVALTNIAAELTRLSGIASHADEIMGDVIVRLGPNDQEHLHALQDVDLLRQSLDCLVVLMKNISEQEEVSNAILPDDVGEGVYLRDLREACLSELRAG